MCKEPSQVPGDKMNKTSGVAGPQRPVGRQLHEREQEPGSWGVSF